MYFCAPEAESSGTSGTISNLLYEETRNRILLLQGQRRHTMGFNEYRTIMRPLMPIIKSNHGSMANSAFLFRNT